MNKKIQKTTKQLTLTGHSDAYIQAYVWAMRDSDTSLDDIQKIINDTRKEQVKSLLRFVDDVERYLKAGGITTKSDREFVLMRADEARKGIRS